MIWNYLGDQMMSEKSVEQKKELDYLKKIEHELL